MLKKSVVGLVVLGLALSLAGPAQAAIKGPMNGVAAISCKAFLPVWPSAVEQQGGSCIGSAAGAIWGLSEKSDGSKNPYVNFCSSGICPFHAEFNYSEICVANGSPPPSGEAEGHAFVDDDAVVIKNGVPVLTKSHLQVPFSWSRLGAIAIIVDGKLAGPNKYKPNDPNKHKTFDGLSDNGQDAVGSVSVAAFAPQGLPNNCPAPGPAQFANVAAVDVEIA